MEIKSERLGVKMIPQVKKSLDKICINENRSISNPVNIIIEKHLGENRVEGERHMIYNNYENDIKVYGDIEIPVPVYEMGKGMDFSILISLLLRSKLDRQKNYRYINYSYIDKEEVCKECNISKVTLSRKLKYLEEKNILIPKNAENGLIYIINYSRDKKYYVNIHYTILRNLITKTNKYAIKLYILLKMQCDIINNNPISNKYLCKQLGYSISSERNLNNISSWLKLLVEHGFIKKVSNRIYSKNEYGKKVITRVDTYYSLNSIESFK